MHFQILVNYRTTEETFTDFQEACKFFNTAVTVLSAARANGAIINLEVVLKSPLEPFFLAETRIEAAGTTDTVYSDVDFKKGRYYHAKDGAFLEVVVGNIGTVYGGPWYLDALARFENYVGSSVSGVGRAGGETVTVFRDCEIDREFIGELKRAANDII